MVCIGTSAVDYSSGILCGRPFGGVAIFWHCDIDSHVKPIYFDCDWLIGLELTIEKRVFTILNVYMPYECLENEDNYLSKLTEVITRIEEINHSCVAVFGDFNANLSLNSGSKFGKYLIDYCNDNHLHISSMIKLPPDSFSLSVVVGQTHG